jgi:hypothetical protein
MSNETDLLPYDEEASVRFIQNFLPQEMKGRFKDDDIYYLMDTLDEFYESKGDLANFDDAAFEALEEELVDFLRKNAAKDEIGDYTPEEIRLILDAEAEYCESIGF